MPALQVARIPRCDPARFARIEAGLLAKGPPRAILVLAGLGEPVLLVGRHQRAASSVDVRAASAAGLRVARRAGGGRGLVIGDGVAGVFLWVPPGEPLAPPVPPDRWLHRYVRGLLGGLRAAGARGAAWLGRDFVAVDGRQLAIVSQEGTAAGGVALEAFVSLGRPLAVPHPYTRYPRDRDPRTAGPRPVTLAEVAGRAVGFDALAAAIEQGYAAASDREPVPAEGILPEAELPPVEEDEAGLRASALHGVPGGFVEALVRSEGGRIGGARIRGDLIAASFGLAALEADLEGSPVDSVEIGRRVDAALRRPHAFVHCARAPQVLVDAVLEAATA